MNVCLFSFLVICLLFTISNKFLNSKKYKIIIQGNSNIGTGASIWVKKKLLDEIKETLKKYLVCDLYEISTSIKNLQIEKVYNEELSRNYIEASFLNNEEFNIFVSADGGNSLQLIATSDVDNPRYFYKYLQEGVGKKEKEDFIIHIVSNLMDVINSLK